MKIKKIIERLLQLHPKSIDLSLSRIRRLLRTLDNPEKKLKNCKILSIDIKKMEKIDGVDFLCCDFQKEK